MAKTNTASPPPPPPPTAASASAPAVAEKPKAKAGFDILRPFRYAKGFIRGTFDGTLNGVANWGHKGMWLGAGVGVLLMLAQAVPGVGFGLVLLGWAGGLVGGALAGGTVGLVTGGARGMGREMRRDKYSEDLMAKARAKSRPQPEVDYRDAHRAYEQRNDYNYDRIAQQQRELNKDTNTYFQDMVRDSRHFNHERGF